MILVFGVSFLALQEVKNRLVMDPSVRGFIGPDHPAAIALRDLESDFGSDALTQVVLEGDVFSAPFLEQLRSLHAELEKIDIELPSSKAGSNSASEPSKKQDSFDSFGDAGWGDEAGGSVIDEVVSLVNARKTEWRDGGLQVGGLMDSWPSEGELPALRERVMTDASMVGRVVGHAGRHAVISVRAHNMPEADRALVFDEVERISRRYQTDTIRVRVGGPAGLNAYLARLMESDFGRLIGVGMLVIVAVVVVLFRHPLGIVGPALVVAKSALWTLGAMAFFGAKVTMMTNILPLFLICVGMGDSVHIQSVYRDNRRRGLPNRAAIVDAVAATGVPVLFTTLTTAVGLLSFQFASLGAIRDLGRFGALGVGVALLLSLVLLPITLSFNRRSLLGVKPASHRSCNVLI